MAPINSRISTINRIMERDMVYSFRKTSVANHQSILSRECSAHDASTAVSTCWISSVGGNPVLSETSPHRHAFRQCKMQDVVQLALPHLRQSSCHAPVKKNVRREDSSAHMN